MSDHRQQQELECERHELNWRIACRANFARQDGYFTNEEFEQLLHELGLLNQWRKEKHNA